jgi:hypothetical protein|tara:strand:- start:335 stop:568 length:234 start_codon:yes stop_codon:yes gene_type:complete
MKFKVSNTLFILGIVLFLVGFLFNYSQVKKSVESSIEKARRMKKEKADERNREKEDIIEQEIDNEVIEILNINEDGK